MKKRKIISIFAAVAIALSCIIVSPEMGRGFNVPVSAAAVVNDGGITLTKVDATNIDTTDTPFVNSLKPGDNVQLNVRIPRLNTNLANMVLRIYYDIDLFTVTKWYAKTDDPEHGQDKVAAANAWPAPRSIVSGTDGDVHYKTDYTPSVGVLSLACSGEPTSTPHENVITAFNDPAVDFVNLKATLKVNSTVSRPTDFKFFIIWEADMDPATNTFHDVFTDDGRGYTAFEYAPDGASDPADYEPVWEPANRLITGSITNIYTGKLTGIDFNAYSAELAAHPIHLTLYKKLGGDTSTTWGEGPDTSRYVMVEDNIPVTRDGTSSDGKFEIRGLDAGTDYYIALNYWGKFTTTNNSVVTLSDKAKITTKGNAGGNPVMNETGSTLTFWMFGDVDGNKVIGATDATLILKFIVGRTSVISYTDGVGNNQYTIANVFDTDNLNARDATQILRKAASLASVFDNRAPFA